MDLCVLSVPITFHVAVPNNTIFYFKKDGKSFWLECEKVKGSKVFSMTEKPIDWLGKDKTSGVHILYYWVKKDNEVGKQQEVFTSTDTSDILGTVIYNNISRIRICFEVDSAFKLKGKDNKEVENIRLYAHDALSHFIDIYGLVSGDMDVQRFTTEEPYCSVLWWTDKYSIDNNELTLNEPELHYITHIDLVKISEHKSLFKKDYIDTQKLCNELNRLSKLSKYLEILMESRSLLSKRHYDLSIVMSETAFEVFLRITLKAICQNAGVISLPNRKNTSFIEYKEAIEKGAIVRDLLRYLNLFSVDNVIGDDKYTKWRKHTHDKRVDIVHKAEFGNSVKEAELAHNSALYFIQYISALTYKNPYQ